MTPTGETAATARVKDGVRTTATTTAARRSSDYVQSVPAVEQATRILAALAEDGTGAVTLAELTRTVGINKSKVLAILNTLCTAGYVTRDERLKTYGLGLGLLTLSRAVLDQTDATRVARPRLDALSLATDATAWLGLVDGDEIVVVDRREHPAGMGIAARVGRRFPLTWGAHGKALLAALPEDERERMLREDRLWVRGNAPVGSPALDDLRAELDECRRLGYAVDLGETRAGVNAIGAVVLKNGSGADAGNGDGSPRPARVVGCVMVVGTFPVEKAAAYGARVAAAAIELSARLGPLL